jgi:predicted ribosomally synthesized peptide with nif11-like leader
MSKESAKLLIEKLHGDEEFRNRILAVEDLDERLKLVKAAGFDCTAEEIEAEYAMLSDNELDNMSAGINLTDCPQNIVYYNPIVCYMRCTITVPCSILSW